LQQWQGISPLSEDRSTIAITLIAAVAENGVIGQGGALPWRLPSELRHFRERTFGKPVVVGRKTYESFHTRPLPGRTNIVVSRDRSYAAAGALVAPSVAAALQVARGDAFRRGVDEIMVAGGADIYAQTITTADRLVITRVRLQPAGDSMFPAIDPTVWQEVSCAAYAAGAQDEASFAVQVYERLNEGRQPQNH
jgi:dihydrofolate reductase